MRERGRQGGRERLLIPTSIPCLTVSERERERERQREGGRERLLIPTSISYSDPRPASLSARAVFLGEERLEQGSPESGPKAQRPPNSDPASPPQSLGPSSSQPLSPSELAHLPSACQPLIGRAPQPFNTSASGPQNRVLHDLSADCWTPREFEL